jgi:RNA-directed DNA polymerase
VHRKGVRGACEISFVLPKGHGGAKNAVRAVRDHLPDNRFVLRTDVKSYYASIDHLMLLDQLAVHIKGRRVLNLIGQYLRRTYERGGTFWDYEKGISSAAR